MSNTLIHSADDKHSNREEASITPGEIAIGVIIGRASEYFDFFVYAIASVLVFPSVFFPFEPRLEGTLYAFVIFAFAFLARPIGTVAFMAIQKRFGRETKLTIALLLLGVSTVGIAFLPTFAHLGYASILLLSLFRVGQGIAVGGSWDGLPSLLALNAPAHRRGWFAMMGQLGAPIGFMMAGGLFAYMSATLSLADFLDWGWRYPFYVAFAINVVAVFARLQLVSSDAFARLLDQKELEPANVIELGRSQGRNVIIGALCALASYALFHLVTVFPLSWIMLYSPRPISGILEIEVIGAGFMILGIITSGIISDKYGRRTTLGIFAMLIAILAGFIPQLMGGSEYRQDVFILIGFALLGLSYGQAAGAVSANFPLKYRYTGAALTSDIAWLVGAGFAPLVALALSAHFGLEYVSLYLLSGAFCTLAALSLNRVLEIRD
jgi:MFS family permease